MNLISPCCHVMATGVHCQSPALKDANFCYAHFRLSKRRHSARAAALAREQASAREAAAARRRRDEQDFNFQFGAIDDRESFRVALSIVIAALAANQISPRRAGPLLNGLQMLSRNLPG